MARTIHKLNATRLPNVRGYHGDGGGLFLRVGPTGAKSWVFRYRVDGRLHEMGLGALHTINLAEAREAALDCRKDLLAFQQGKAEHPLAIRQAAQAASKAAAAKAITFRECAERYIEAHQAGWRNPRNLGQWNASLTQHVYPVLGALPVNQIDLGLVMSVLEPIWNTIPETASRVRGRLEAVLDWATGRGYRTGENPARWKGNLKNQLPEKAKVKANVKPIAHHAALPYPEIGEFMVALRQHDGVVARALEFAILTGARSNEVVGARWDEINLAERLWTVPGARMKTNNEHRVPLSTRAIEILHTMERGVYVFGGARKIARDALLRQLRQMGRDEAVHGFRSTFATWAAERSNFPHEVCELALAHTVGTAVERAYQRGDMFEKRRQLAEAWAAFIDRVEPAAGQVVPIIRAM